MIPVSIIRFVIHFTVPRQHGHRSGHDREHKRIRPNTVIILIQQVQQRKADFIRVFNRKSLHSIDTLGRHIFLHILPVHHIDLNAGITIFMKPVAHICSCYRQFVHPIAKPDNLSLYIACTVVNRFFRRQQRGGVLRTRRCEFCAFRSFSSSSNRFIRLCSKLSD